MADFIASLNFNYQRTITITSMYDDAFTITSLENNNTISWDLSWQTVKYSLNNGLTWNTFTGGEIYTISKGESIMFIGDNVVYSDCNISSTGNFNVSGNIMSLIDSENYRTLNEFEYDYVFYNVFNGSKVVDASKLKMPATTLTECCYLNMFLGCTDMIAAPELPATTLAQGCYNGMFWGASLITPPALPATTLASGCYDSMFRGCSSLTTAPELPATTLVQDCYKNMFSGCENLHTTPTLPSTSLAQGCYENMFEGCTTLITPPELPATILRQDCYKNMFNGCIAIKSAPELPATTLASGCYENMFDGCTNLNYIKVTITSYSNTNDEYTNWVLDVADSGTFVQDVNAEFPIDSVDGVPIGWTIQYVGQTPTVYYNVNVTIDPAGKGVVYGGGTYESGTGCTLTASPVSGYLFDGYYINNTKVTSNTSYSFVVNSNISITAKFYENLTVYYTVSLSQDPAIGSTLSGNGTYVANSSVTVNATNVQGYIFSGWYENNILVSEDNNYTFNIESNRTLTAKFSEDLSGTYLTIEAVRDGVELRWGGDTQLDVQTPKTIYYSINNGLSWHSVVSDTNNPPLIASLNKGDKVLIKGNETTYKNSHFTCTGLASGTYDAYKVYGNIMSMLYGDDFKNKIVIPYGNGTIINNESYIWTFARLFITYVSDASKLVLPATTLSCGCYSEMFAGCRSLATIPKLPATTLALYCYEGMFNNCKSLVNAPALPATTLAWYCYKDMFSGCDSLVNAPALPATTLETGCYEQMFYACSSLTTAPVLSATTLKSSCYKQMFKSCRNLSYIKCLATDRYDPSYPAPYNDPCTYLWVEGVPNSSWIPSRTGTFVKNAETSNWISGNSGIPDGWTVQDAS